MKWTKSELLEAIQAGDPKIRNYFDTFGIVVIKGLLTKKEFKQLLCEYDQQYAARMGAKKSVVKMLLNRLGFSGPKQYGFKAILREMCRGWGMRFLPDFVDSSPLFMNHFFSEKMMPIYRYFAGERFLYLGSDGSHFITTSFPWHKDWYTKMPIMKFNFYFNPFPFFGGKFMVIPGSNYTEDAYARFLQKSMAWPMQNKHPGGLAENDFLPMTQNPRRHPITFLTDYFKDLFGMNTQFPDVPHVEVKVSKGDVVLFDQRLIHCVQSNFPPFSRRLLTVLLSKNAYEFSDDHYLLKSGNTRESLMREVVDLVVSERNHIACPAYGDAMYEHPFSKGKHFISIDKIQTNTPADESKYNVGSFELEGGERFTSVLDVNHYAAIGAKYRQDAGENQKDKKDILAQQYSYGDVHLGINAQNITKISNR
ncbi:MAG TPA: phytanoyl-CoA dioxygenase family protein [Rickettsiales bacterium]|nr:phytanoyl-CoA dioxygenase family protein [Rickettsiales bacterium]